MKDLKNLQILVDELNESNSTLAKKAVLAKHPECKRLLEYVYNPFKLYGVKPDNLKKNAELVSMGYDNIYELLDALNARELTGHDAIAAVNGFIELYEDYKDLIYNIFDRSLKTRADASLINKVWPGLIKEFDVALAVKFEEVKNIDYTDEYFASRKMDGIRVIAVIDNGNIKFYSRKGKEFTTLVKIETAIKEYIPELQNAVLDGEICIVDEEGNENFKAVQSLIKRKNYTIENPKYNIFDILNPDEFWAKEGNTPFSLRAETLRKLPVDGKYLEVIEQRYVEDEDAINAFMDFATNNGWEGIMLRKNTGYNGKRSKDLIKLKKFQDAEYVVKGIDVGTFRVIEDGQEIEIETLAAVKIEHKGYEVSVGSGFSLDERKYYYEHPEEIIGKEITVKYFEESKNKKGGISLRFPIIKAIYDEGREV